MQSSQIRIYNRNECITFRKTKEAFGGLSNMAGGYNLKVNGVNILTAEALYQACRFPHLPEIQKLIIAQNSPMTAKMKSKPYRDQSRQDWDKVRVNIMRWCLRVKLVQNWEKFGQLLLQTGDKSIVEDSSKDEFWGARPTENNQLVGANVLGRLLMELREHLKQGANFIELIKTPSIPNFYLFNQPIENIVLNQNIINSVKRENFELNTSDLPFIDDTKLNYEDKQEEINICDGINENIVEHKQQDVNLIKEISENILPSHTEINKNVDKEDEEKEDNIFEDWVLPKLEKILQTPLAFENILEHFKTVNKKQLQDWLKLATESGKVKKLEKPVRYMYSAYKYKYVSQKPRVNKPRTTQKTSSQSVTKSKLNVNEEITQLSLI
jgi:ribA/ribD-fused uncharacterized protein